MSERVRPKLNPSRLKTIVFETVANVDKVVAKIDAGNRDVLGPTLGGIVVANLVEGFGASRGASLVVGAIAFARFKMMKDNNNSPDNF